MKLVRTGLAAALLITGIRLIADEPSSQDDLLQNQSVGFDASGTNCSFKADPDSFLSMAIRGRQRVADRVNRLAVSMDAATAVPGATVSPLSLPRTSFIDDEIFNKLATSGVKAAQLTTDEEFFRRINLDLTGHIPTPAAIRAFEADTTPNKRNALIDQLLYSPAFNDKWTMWLGDLLQNSRTLPLAAPRQVGGRNAFYQGLYNFIASYGSVKDLAVGALTASGNNYDGNGYSNYYLDGITSGGPANDNYDMQAFMAGKHFLGLGNYDCLMCHNGRGHLDQLNLWATGVLRSDAENMSAFFSRATRAGYTYPPNTTLAQQQADPHYQSQIISDGTATTSNYQLPTTYGNRPNRPLINGKNTADMIYRDGRKPATGQNPRQAFASYVVSDPMFATNFANRLWQQMFNYGLVDTADYLDPARLDPNNPPDPSTGWTLQATHPVLLQKLAQYFVATNYNVRETLRLIAQSSAYQMSSRYNDAWDSTMVGLFARHYNRRLMAEEVADAIKSATGSTEKYTINGFANQVSWAMQSPDTTEINNNVLISFLRGDRDSTPRSSAVTIQQSMTLMNDTFVMGKFHATQSPTLQAIQKLSGTTAQVQELYMTFLGRMPSTYELTTASSPINAGYTTAAKTAALEDLAWALINKVEFAYSY